MIEPLFAAYGVVGHRKTVFVRVIAEDSDGWGECVALNEPIYTEDWSDGEYAILKDYLIPAILQGGDVTAETALERVRLFKRHNAAKSALEMAILDAQLRCEGRSLAQYWGVEAKSVECAVVVGLMDGDALVNAVRKQVERGYRHVKLKIVPGRDVDRVDLITREFPLVALRVDANGSYDWNEASHRKRLFELDEFGLASIEQPLSTDSPIVYRELKSALGTPIALDESITSVDRAHLAMQLDICDIITLKPGLIGGYLAARNLHDLCLREGFSCSVGGMIETGLARAANLALAGLSAASAMPAEISPDGRWFSDVVNSQAVELKDGHIDIPDMAGIGVDLDTSVVNRLTRHLHVAGA